MQDLIDTWMLDQRRDAFYAAQKAFLQFKEDFNNRIDWKSFAPDKEADQSDNEHEQKHKRRAEELRAVVRSVIGSAEITYKAILADIIKNRVAACGVCAIITRYEAQAVPITAANEKTRDGEPINLVDLKQIELEDNAISFKVSAMKRYVDAIANAKQSNLPREEEDARDDLRRSWGQFKDLRRQYSGIVSPLMEELRREYTSCDLQQK